MNIYELNDEEMNEERIADALVETLERDTGKRVFTMRIFRDSEHGLESLIVFEDTSILTGVITVQTIDKKLAVRIQGNYI